MRNNTSQFNFSTKIILLAKPLIRCPVSLTTTCFYVCTNKEKYDEVVWLLPNRKNAEIKLKKWICYFEYFPQSSFHLCSHYTSCTFNNLFFLCIFEWVIRHAVIQSVSQSPVEEEYFYSSLKSRYEDSSRSILDLPHLQV